MFAHRFFQFIQLLLEKPKLGFLGQRNALKARMRDDHRVPISRGDAAEKFPAVFGFKVFLAGDQDVRARIQDEQLGRELAEHVIGHGEHGFASQPQPFQLHRGGDHRVGLARADDMAKQGVVRLQNAPHTRFLMQMQLNGRACPRQRQVLAVKRAETRMIERVVVEAAKPLPS